MSAGGGGTPLAGCACRLAGQRLWRRSRGPGAGKGAPGCPHPARPRPTCFPLCPRPARSLAPPARDMAPLDLDSIELPENHPFAVKKKLAPGGRRRARARHQRAHAGAAAARRPATASQALTASRAS